VIAQVATQNAIDRTFDYAIPGHLADRVRPGSRVKVPFGTRVVEGYVLALADTTAHTGKLKPILETIGDRPWLSETLLRLAAWMASYYLAPVELCLAAMLPAPVRRADAGFKLRLRIERVDPPPADAPEPTARQREILDILARTGSVALAAFCREWRVSSTTVRKLEESGFVAITEQAERRDPMAGRRILPSQPLPLTDEQAAAKALVCAAMDDAFAGRRTAPVLLHGVTASGKTEVFLQCIADALEQGRGAIALVPEIALTPQTIQRFASRFGTAVAVLHSQLGDGERHDEWHRIHTGEARVVVGPRSAVFAPVERLGVIIVDEEHEPSYKQDETPRYHARDVAVMRGALEPCVVVLGSATPSLESWRNAQTGKYRLATLTRRAVDQTMPRTEIVDMRAEVAARGALPVFSERLVAAIRRRLELGEQTMLFLNRRGYAPTVMCPKCGRAEHCDNCSIGMTFHLDDDLLRCHLCGAFRQVPETCPDCGAPDCKYSGIGTQRVETIAKRLFPRARIQRMDADVTSRKFSHEEIIGRFRAGKIDILIGTQMIAKGLDFPNVTLAGILNADAGLHIPDFRASERTFQLIAQMAGRCGRGATPGDVLVQTLSPEHPAIVHARTEDFQGFAAIELAERRELAYPPFTRFTCITLRGRDATQVAAYAQRLADAIGPSDRFILGGPNPAPLERAKQDWRYQITLRGAGASTIAAAIRQGLAAAKPPAGVAVVLDIDALSSL
jgi:primosomal protein N' (replication factor Y)